MSNLSRVLIVLLMLAGVLAVPLHGGNPPRSFGPVKSPPSAVLDTASVPADAGNPRMTTALIYSCVMPGAGQTMLGHTFKGTGFTLAAFGSVLTAVISHNNFVARNERLDALEYQYANATNWVSADVLYSSMKEAHSQMISDRDRRNIFIAVAAVIWTANIVDVLYNTDDQGETLFSVVPGMPENRTVALQHTPVVSLSLRLP